MATPKASYILDGAGDYVSVGDSANLDADTYISLGIWVKLDYDALDSGDVYLFDRAVAHSIWIDVGGKVHFSISGGGEAISNGRLPLDQPVFVVCTAIDSGTNLVMKIYIEGVIDETLTIAGAGLPVAVAVSTYIGAYRTPANYVKGTISSVFMTNDLVTAAEVLACYNDADGDHTGNIDSLSISIMTATEPDATNDNGAAGAGNVRGTAVIRTYMDLFQSMGSGNVMQIGEAMTRYNTHQPILVKKVKWFGDEILDNSQLTLTDWGDKSFLTHYATAVDTGIDRDFGDGMWVNGLKIATLAKGLLEITIG